MLAYRAQPNPDAMLDRALAGVIASGGSLGDSKPRQVEFFSPNAQIYAQGDRATALYQVEYGVVRLFRLLSDGRRQICAFHVAGEVFGFADGQHHLFAEAVCDAAVRVFRGPIREDKSLLTLAMRELVRAQDHLLVIGRQTACERIAAFMVDLYDRLGHEQHFELAMSRTDIADYLGLTIETVSRVFSKFRSKGYIKLHGTRGVDILQIEALRGICA